MNHLGLAGNCNVSIRRAFPLRSKLRRCASFFKKMVTPAVKREAVVHLKAHLGLSELRACEIAGADRKMVRYQSLRAPDTALRGRLLDLANERRR
jgi:hypothetical protein